MLSLFNNLYFRHISNPDKSWKYFLKQVSFSCENSIEVVKKWEKSSCILFTPQRYTEILQLSFMKNWHNLSSYLLDNKTFIYPFLTAPENKGLSKIHLLDRFMTGNLLAEDHAAWLALMSCHHPCHLMDLDKNYNFQHYYSITRKFLLHPSFKEVYKDKDRRALIISRCPTNADKMLLRIFLEMDLGSSIKKEKPVKI